MNIAIRRVLILGGALIMMMSQRGVAGDVADDVYPDFVAGRYASVFATLLSHRIENEGTLRIDFMLAVSACRSSEPIARALGGQLLVEIQSAYRMTAQNRADIQRQASACPRGAMTVSEGVSKLSGKSDAEGQRLHAGRSDRGTDERLPAANIVVPPPPSRGVRGMSALMLSVAYPPPDYRVLKVGTALQCAELCAQESRCRAMTFIVGKRECNLKEQRSEPLKANADFVSAARQ